MDMRTAFNPLGRETSFDGNLRGAFACQAANDPQMNDIDPAAAIAARNGLGGLAAGQKVFSFGNAPGLAQAALAGMEINNVSAPENPSTTVQQNFNA